MTDNWTGGLPTVLMESVIEKYPLPWQVVDLWFNDVPYITDANGSHVISAHWSDDANLLRLIVGCVNRLSDKEDE